MPVYYPIIKKVTGGGGGSMEGFHMVRFFNDDRTTLLYTVFVPDGSSAMYAGETPVSATDGVVFTGFEPSPVNVTADFDCYAVYEGVGTLDETPWAIISKLSADGTAQNYFAVGDTKMIHIEGTVGTIAVNGDYGVYIIGFDHNEELEGKGIHFGTFKTALSNGVNVALLDSAYDTEQYGSKYFNINHWSGKPYGRWAACDLRYDVLGSTNVEPSGYGASPTTDRVGYDPTENCATNPVAGTLMSALPADLREVMTPMTKYTNNGSEGNGATGQVTATLEYLPLLAEFEFFGVYKAADVNEQKYQKQYAYFAEGADKKYSHSNNSTLVRWWSRSCEGGSTSSWSYFNSTAHGTYGKNKSLGISPIFKV